MNVNLRAAFAALFVLAIAACSGMSGLDSGMPGEVGPPVNTQGSLNQMGGPGAPGAMNEGGPTPGANGQVELTNPGATLAPNQKQYPIGDGPSGMKCPTLTLQGGIFNCTFSFNVPASPSPGASGSPKPKPTPSPTPTPTAAPSSGDDSDSSSDDPTPTPTPPGTLTMQVEAMPTDVPGMTNPDLRALRTVAVVGLRLQSDTDFVLDGSAIANYILPKAQFAGRQFALQLYNESFPRIVGKTSKRIDTFIGGYSKNTLDSDASSVNFTFTVPKITVKRGQIWLMVLYGLTYPPNSTPTPSPNASASASASPGASPSAGASPSPAASPSPH